MNTEELIASLSNNKSAADITFMYDLLTESIRHYLSRSCFTNNATEINPYMFEMPVDVDGTFGLSELEKLQFIGMYETPDGIIYFKNNWCHDIELDDVSMAELISIVNAIDTGL